MAADETTTAADGGEPATVLVVDDEPSVADLYTNWLSTRYEVRTAYGGEAALSAVEDGVDAVFLDRRMPKHSGDEVLAEIRDRGHDVPVAMVTAVEPDLDLTHMPCQGYLVKSVERADLLGAAEQMLRMAAYDRKRRELSAKQVRRNVLQAELSAAELRGSESFERLEREIESLKTELAELSETFDGDDEAASADEDGDGGGNGRPTGHGSGRS